MQKIYRKKYIITIICLIIVLITGIKFAFEYGKKQANNLVISDEAKNWDKEIEDKSSGEKGIKVPGYDEITIRSNSDIWAMTLLNPEDNNCYFKYTITVNDSSKVIYESDLIEPGKAITEFEPSFKLDKGEYELYLTISTYSLDQKQTPLNGAKIKTTLHMI